MEENFKEDLAAQKAENFTIWKSKLNQLYTPDSVDRLLRKTTNGSLSKLNDPDQVRTIFERGISNVKDLVDASKMLYATDNVYSSIINHYRDLYYYRHTTVPIFTTKSKKDITKEEYSEIYAKIVSIVDGINIPVIYPQIISRILIEGVVYLYLNLNKKSEAIETIFLPMEYCKPGPRNQHGITGIQFDLQYVEELRKSTVKTETSNNSTTLVWEEVLGALPKEWSKAYTDWINGVGERYIILDQRFSATVKANDYLVPPKLSLLVARGDYQQIKKNELEKSQNELVDILTHQIPSYQDKLLLEIDEALALHQSMSRAFGKEKNLKLMTTFGNTVLHNRARANAAENKAREQSLKSMFDDAGVNYYLFDGNTKYSVDSSWARDESEMRVYIDEITSVYLMAINNLIKFKNNMEARFDILEITCYNYNIRMSSYKDAATLGVGKLNYIVASGIEQSSLESQLILEDFLELDNLRPLQTSYTTSERSIVERNKQIDEEEKGEEKLNSSKTEVENE